MTLDDFISRADHTVLLSSMRPVRVVLLVEQVNPQGELRVLSAIPDCRFDSPKAVNLRTSGPADPPLLELGLPRFYVPDYPFRWEPVVVSRELGYRPSDFLDGAATGKTGIHHDAELFWCTVGPGQLGGLGPGHQALIFNAQIRREEVSRAMAEKKLRGGP